MIYTIENDVLSLSVNGDGGSMTSLVYKPTGEERLWQGDEKWWKGQDVVIFPIVGHAGGFTAKGKSCALRSHGIIRYVALELRKKSDHSLTLGFRSDSATYENYPYEFDFEISYKLNGMPVRAEDLAGASGLVETDVKVIPRDDCSEYMKNNMILSCFIPVDDEKVYSVDAPGSQTQTVGDMTGVMFTALPGEEKEFAVRLGCNDYESIGVIFLMIPKG